MQMRKPFADELAISFLQTSGLESNEFYLNVIVEIIIFSNLSFVEATRVKRKHFSQKNKKKKKKMENVKISISNQASSCFCAALWR